MTKAITVVQQIKSPIRRHHRQRKTLIGLGLNKVGKIAEFPSNSQMLGMIEKTKHLLKIIFSSKELPLKRFNALAAYTRKPEIILYIEDIEWYATDDERLLGVLVHDLHDHDFGWVILGRDEQLRFRAVDVGHSESTVVSARQKLFANLQIQQNNPDEEFYQYDSTALPFDLFKLAAPEQNLSLYFKTLQNEERYSPAREIIRAMMYFYGDLDGNFIQQFQTTGFDARLWELYLFATFTELGFAPQNTDSVPDFIFSGPFGSFGVEATSINQGAQVQFPQSKEQLINYIENYIPIRIARVLKRKLERENPYWLLPEMAGLPFVIAVQDFHLPGAMRMILPAMTEYVYGFRQDMEDFSQIKNIQEHNWENLRERSGFFNFPGAENVSAIIINPQGTLPKFNRMGFLAGFGNRRVKMTRTGVATDPADDSPRPFKHDVSDPLYDETWVEGMVVLHNPNARIPLLPDLIPGARHEFLQPTGRTMSLVPSFHPLFSATSIDVI